MSSYLIYCLAYTQDLSFLPHTSVDTLANYMLCNDQNTETVVVQISDIDLYIKPTTKLATMPPKQQIGKNAAAAATAAADAKNEAAEDVLQVCPSLLDLSRNAHVLLSYRP